MLSSAGSISLSGNQPYTTHHTLDGDICMVHCSTVGAIDRFMMSGCSDGMTKAERTLFNDFVKYSDGVIAERPELKALDQILVSMATSALSCVEIQRGYCGA